MRMKMPCYGKDKQSDLFASPMNALKRTCSTRPDHKILCSLAFGGIEAKTT